MRARQLIIIIIHVATDQRMDGTNTNWRQPPKDTWTGRAFHGRGGGGVLSTEYAEWARRGFCRSGIRNAIN